MVRYDAALLASLPETALDGPVANLCRGSTPAAVASAALLEGWVERFQAPRKCRDDITSPEASAFWSGWWELATAAAMSSLGFAVDLRGRLPDGRTPDLIVERGGLKTMVEVFVVGNDARTLREQDLLNALARELGKRLSMRPGLFLSVSMRRRITDAPPEGALVELVRALQQWLDADEGTRFEHRGRLPLRVIAMPGGHQSQVSVTPVGGVLSQAGRIQSRLKAKIERYAPSASGDLRLTVAVCEGGWKVTRSQMLDALYGQERLYYDDRTGATLPSYDGSGVAVPDGPRGAAGAASFSGAWYLSRVLHRAEPPAVGIDVSFAHSPYCVDPFTPGSLHPVPELQAQGEALAWVADEPLILTLG